MRPYQRFERNLRWFVVLGVFFVTLSRGSAGAQWQADLSVLGHAELIPTTLGGLATRMGAQVMALVPLGSIWFRTMLLSALATGLFAGILYQVGCSFQDKWSPPLGARLIAAVGATGTALSVPIQREATTAGGAAVALLLFWAGVSSLMVATDPDERVLTARHARRWLVVATLLGFALVENLLVGVGLLLAVVGVGLSSDRRPPKRVVALAASVTVAIVFVGVVAVLLPRIAPHGVTDIGGDLAGLKFKAPSAESQRATIAGWMEQGGLLPTLGGIAGMFMLALSARHRRLLVVLVLGPMLHVLLPQPTGAATMGSAFAVLPMLAMASFGVGMTAVVMVAASGLARLSLPYWRAALVMGIACFGALALLLSEESGFRVAQRDRYAAETWTDEALMFVPPRATLLVESPTIAWRLWSSQVVSGLRPDVVVIAAPLVRQGKHVNRILPRVPESASLLRDYALTGVGSEFALSSLADARPLLVELDPRWKPTVVKHLRVEGPWLRYSPERLQKSDHGKELAHVLGQSSPLRREIEGVVQSDPFSSLVVARTLKQHASALALSGLPERAKTLVDGVKLSTPQDPFVVAAGVRLRHAAFRRRTIVELRDLLDFGQTAAL